MYRAIATIGLLFLLVSTAAGQDGWTEWNLDDRPQVWRIPVGAGAGSAFPDGLSIAGQEVRMLRVYAQGLVTLNDALPADFAGDPMPLDMWAGVPLIAPFWAELAERSCPGVDDEFEPTVRWRFDELLQIEWRNIPHASCTPSLGAVTVAMTIDPDVDDSAAITFRYIDVGQAGAFAPRAGLVTPGGSIELFPDETLVPDRAKALLDGGSERVRFAPEDAGPPDPNEPQAAPPVERGVWTIDVGADGRILGDPDRDGVNRNDNCGRDPNPEQLDLDRNGRGDVCDLDDDRDGVNDPDDNCPRVHNPAQADMDGDGPGDACDDDQDGDGWPNRFDICPTVPDPDRLDLDGDGRGDACDHDPDGDVIFSMIFGSPLDPDLCPFIPQRRQRDADGDAIGDPCDLRPHRPCRGMGCVTERDDDGDGISNVVDLCPTASDPQQLDADRDWRGDACDGDADGDEVLDMLGILMVLERAAEPELQ